MIERDRHVDVEIGSERSFGFVFGAVFLIIALWPLKNGADIRLWAMTVSAVFFLIALAAPQLLKPFNWLWFKFGILLGFVVAPLVMGLVYFLTVTPTGLIMRLWGKDILRLKPDPETETYWIPRTETTSMDNQF